MIASLGYCNAKYVCIGEVILFICICFLFIIVELKTEIDFFPAVLTTVRVSIIECHSTGSCDNKYFCDKTYSEPEFSRNLSFLWLPFYFKEKAEKMGKQ